MRAPHKAEWKYFEEFEKTFSRSSNKLHISLGTTTEIEEDTIWNLTKQCL